LHNFWEMIVVNEAGCDALEKLEEILQSGSGPKVVRYALSCLGGLVPFAGGAIGGAASTWSEAEQARYNRLLISWLKLHEEEVKEIGRTLVEVMIRLDQNDEGVRKRIESPEYLSLVKKCFRDWSAAESEGKRVLIRNLLSNAAGGQKICGDDIIRLFIEWIDRYSEGHFRIIRETYKNPGITRHEIWQKIHGEKVREDSAEADLFKLFIHELSMGRIVRQHREKDYHGNFVKTRSRRSSGPSQIMTSAFDDEKPYELTELGQWFVHYTMNEIVPKLEGH
jgi:hypothetical protein